MAGKAKEKKTTRSVGRVMSGKPATSSKSKTPIKRAGRVVGYQ